MKRELQYQNFLQRLGVNHQDLTPSCDEDLREQFNLEEQQLADATVKRTQRTLVITALTMALLGLLLLSVLAVWGSQPGNVTRVFSHKYPTGNTHPAP